MRKMRDREDDLFAGVAIGEDGKPIAIPGDEDVIIRVTASVTESNHFAVYFDTKRASFGYIVVIQNLSNLSSKETKCLRDVMNLSVRGSVTKIEDFHAKYKDRLIERYQCVDLKRQGSVCIYVIRPSSVSAHEQRKGDYIQSSKIYFRDQAGSSRSALVCEIRIESGAIHQIVANLISPHDGRGLSILECQALSDIFDMCEPPDFMDEDQLCRWAVRAIKKFNVVTVERDASAGGRGLVVSVTPTFAESLQEVCPFIRAWVDKLKNRESASPSPSPSPSPSSPSPSPPSPSLSPSPSHSISSSAVPVYNGFTIESKICESELSTMYFGVQVCVVSRGVHFDTHTHTHTHTCNNTSFARKHTFLSLLFLSISLFLHTG